MKLMSILCAAILLALPQAAAAQGDRTTYIVPKDVSQGILNMRRGPGQGHELVIAIPGGSAGITKERCSPADDGVSRYDWCLVKWRSFRGWVSNCCLQESTTAASASSPGTAFPLVFGAPAELKQVGLSVGGDEPDPIERRRSHFPTRCYYYGDGGVDISMSDEFLNAYREKGFSRRSLCMALVSEIRFNPENGKRLATYIVIFDQKELRQGNGGLPGVLSPELPLSIPACFAGGTPYSDCVMNYDPMTGRRLTDQERLKYKSLGERLERSLAEPRRRFSSKEETNPNEFTYGEILVGYGREPLVQENTHVAFYDYAAEFPKGYGYALYADGAAAPAVSASVVRSALAGNSRPRPQIRRERLRDLLDGR